MARRKNYTGLPNFLPIPELLSWVVRIGAQNVGMSHMLYSAALSEVINLERDGCPKGNQGTIIRKREVNAMETKTINMVSISVHKK